MSIVLEAASIGYRFARSQGWIYHDLNVVLRKGEFLGVAGASGRGKSTLLFTLGLSLRPSMGSIYVDGLDAAAASDAVRAKIRRELVGFVFQDAVLDPGRTVLDNVLEASVYRGLDKRSLKARALTLLGELDVESRATAKAGKTSGGQGQRIALCRALLFEPALLMADEPTANLDQATASKVIDLLQQHAQNGRTVVTATHDPRVLDACSRVLQL